MLATSHGNPNAANIILDNLSRIGHPYSHTVNTYIVICRISPCQTCIIFVINRPTVVDMLHKISCGLHREMLFAGNAGHTGIHCSAKKHGYQIFSMSKNIVSTSSNDDTVFVGKHIGKHSQRLFRYMLPLIAVRGDRKEEFVYRTLVKEIVQLVF